MNQEWQKRVQRAAAFLDVLQPDWYLLVAPSNYGYLFMDPEDRLCILGQLYGRYSEAAGWVRWNLIAYSPVDAFQLNVSSAFASWWFCQNEWNAEIMSRRELHAVSWHEPEVRSGHVSRSMPKRDAYWQRIHTRRSKARSNRPGTRQGVCRVNVLTR